MPLYEYRCQSCGALEEKLEGFSAPTEHDCPKCEAAVGMKRQISRTAFALAGSGWYASGYGEGKSSGDSAPSGTESPAAKPEAKSEPAAGSGGCAGGCACH